ncbi:MAG: HAD-IA family hydrolase [Okeania sp. SIO3I5]|uniref:HAD-IA family hydrolase n=1 Tax=Okeania sp. SIO3I5 TaxID=2607805 RepID=UPI0013BC7BC0|nr:HAD-IA family hydrolase [Okeania sp. SIO3I5]NEQ41314.1 HAD-IA family hydrolase [Okeania sp. SIO3I5]
MIKIVIFDFDGTLADTFDLIFAIANRLSVEFGYKQANKEEIPEIEKLNPLELINQSGISIFKVPFLLKRIRAEFKKEINDVGLFSGIKEALLALKLQGYKIGIITSNGQENVEYVLQKYDLLIFDFMDSGTTLFGKHRVIKKYLKSENIQPEEMVYVGDETRDINAAKKAKIKAIAVTWGFNSREALSEYQPDALVDQPQELIEVINNF